MKLAKFIYHKESKTEVLNGDRSYDDLGIIKELRKLFREVSRRSKGEEKVTSDEKLNIFLFIINK
jgi:hypothetical protein